eukprot:JP437251.1.p1 GENE.JP437251.1~~JP437251.1.p1  ORF type:complete len:191 (-),score=34.06 JP437251.1:41-613(-)
MGEEEPEKAPTASNFLGELDSHHSPLISITFPHSNAFGVDKIVVPANIIQRILTCSSLSLHGREILESGIKNEHSIQERSSERKKRKILLQKWLEDDDRLESEFSEMKEDEVAAPIRIVTKRQQEQEAELQSMRQRQAYLDEQLSHARANTINEHTSDTEQQEPTTTAPKRNRAQKKQSTVLGTIAGAFF